MLRRDLACVKSCQNLYCSRTCAKWRTYGIFFQSILRRDLVFMQSCQSLHCSHTCAKWAYIRHISSVNALTRWAFVPSSQSLHCSRTYTKWAFIRHILSAYAQTCLSVCAVLPEPLLALAHAQNGRTYGIFFQSMLRRDLACVKSCQSLYCSRTCTNGVHMAYFCSQCSNET